MDGTRRSGTESVGPALGARDEMHVVEDRRLGTSVDLMLCPCSHTADMTCCLVGRQTPSGSGVFITQVVLSLSLSDEISASPPLPLLYSPYRALSIGTSRTINSTGRLA